MELGAMRGESDSESQQSERSEKADQFAGINVEQLGQAQTALTQMVKGKRQSTAKLTSSDLATAKDIINKNFGQKLSDAASYQSLTKKLKALEKYQQAKESTHAIVLKGQGIGEKTPGKETQTQNPTSSQRKKKNRGKSQIPPPQQRRAGQALVLG